MIPRGLLLFIAIFLIFLKNFPTSGQERKITHQSPFDSATCIENSIYFVISRSANTVGDDISVRAKSVPDSKYQCRADKEISHYRVANAGEAKYVLGLIDNFLILDQGTGPSSRRLSIINLSTRHELWSGDYANDPSIVKNSIRFLKYLRNGDKRICPNYSKIVSENWTPIFVVPSEIKLPDLTVRMIGPPKCIASQ